MYWLLLGVYWIPDQVRDDGLLRSRDDGLLRSRNDGLADISGSGLKQRSQSRNTLINLIFVVMRKAEPNEVTELALG